MNNFKSMMWNDIEPVISELTQQSGSLTPLAPDLGWTRRKYHRTVHKYLCTVHILVAYNRWIIEMAFNGGGGGGIQWRWQCLTAFNGISNGLWQGNGKAKIAGTMRGQEGSARRGNTTSSRHNERRRGQRNERRMRYDATTS